MWRKKSYGFLLLALLFLTLACRAPKTLLDKKADLSQIEQIIRSYQNAHLTPSQNISISGKMRIEKEGQGRSAHAKINIQPGEKIWINASFLGFPIGRALITPEGIAAYERIQKTYLKADFSLAKKYLKADFLDYIQLEKLFLGSSLFKLSGENYKLLPSQVYDLYILTSKGDSLITDEAKAVKGYTHMLEMDGNFCIKRETIKKTDASETLTVAYDGWQKVDGRLFPGKIDIFVNEKSRPVFSVEVEGIKTNGPIDTLFSIPEGYKERNW